MNLHLQKYMSSGFDSVPGWCDMGLFTAVDKLNKIQNAFEARAGVLEIGVHHGKFFILLNQVTEEDDCSAAIDLFDEQTLNIDQSGSGDLLAFKRNLELFDRHGGKNVRIFSTDSTTLTPSLFGDTRFRFISIDGGHTTEHTLNDLGLVVNWLHSCGVVFVDDIFNYHWPGVIEGVIRFLLTAPTLVPFAIGYNKLLLCRLSYYRCYFEAMRTSGLETKLVSLVGRQLVAF